MAKPEVRERPEEIPLENLEPETPRVPVGLSDAAQRIVNHLIKTEAKHRLVRVRGMYVLIDVTKAEPVDIGELGHKLGVLDECEVIV